jgi:hypothetical protein
MSERHRCVINDTTITRAALKEQRAEEIPPRKRRRRAFPRVNINPIQLNAVQQWSCVSADEVQRPPLPLSRFQIGIEERSSARKVIKITGRRHAPRESKESRHREAFADGLIAAASCVFRKRETIRRRIASTIKRNTELRPGDKRACSARDSLLAFDHYPQRFRGGSA